MTPITAPSPTTAVPDAIDALPGQASVQQPATGRPCPRALVPGVRPGGRTGPLRSGNPRGNPNLAPRCGAKARRTGCACRAPAMANGRCRMHGGKSTGPRTPEGLASLARAGTRHGEYGAAGRAQYRYRRMVVIRSRVLAAAEGLRPYLPRELIARLDLGTTELSAPRHPSNGPVATNADKAPCSVAPGRAARDARGRFAARARPALRGRAAEREAARQERASLAPWRAGIKRARLIKRLLRSQDQTARRAARGQGPVQRMPPGA